jgi:hypothetical protein
MEARGSIAIASHEQSTEHKAQSQTMRRLYKSKVAGDYDLDY